MPRPKPLTKEDILRAMKNTRSNRAGARFLNVSYQHYRIWAKRYKSDKPEFNNLLEEHRNWGGKGVPKFLKGSGKEPALLDLIEGRTNMASFSPEKIKYRLVVEGYLEEECQKCKFHERRVLDYKMPLLLHFKDGNKTNYRKENIEFLCYNCYFLSVGDIFTDKQVKGMEDHRSVNQSEVDWELDSYHLERLKTLGLGNEGPAESNLISHL